MVVNESPCMDVYVYTHVPTPYTHMRYINIHVYMWCINIHLSCVNIILCARVYSQ